MVEAKAEAKGTVEEAAREPSAADGRGTRAWPGAFSTPRSNSRPADYAALEAVFLLGLGGVVALSRRRDRQGAPGIPRSELPTMALATFTLADVLAKEKISTWLRDPFVVEGADHRPVAPQGGGMRYAIGELLTCTRCVGTWSALGLVGLRTASPVAGQATAAVLALSGANDLIQSAFRLLVERANRAIIQAEAAATAAHS